jgi:hypothetical protein
MATKQNTKFVLVPGAFHLSDYQKGIKDHLLHLGYDSTIVRLPTVGAPPACASLEDDVEAILSAIRDVIVLGADAIVVAHSYGAVPATEAVGRLLTEVDQCNKPHGKMKMVFVAAYVLLEGQTVASVGSDLYNGMAPPATPSDLDFTVSPLQVPKFPSLRPTTREKKLTKRGVACRKHTAHSTSKRNMTFTGTCPITRQMSSAAH